MTAKPISVLTHPHPCRHIVFSSAEDEVIVSAAGLFVAGGLANEESVVLIATTAHRAAIERSLEESGFDVADLRLSGQLSHVDAEVLLEKLLAGDSIDAAQFHALVGEVLVPARKNSATGDVRVFAEMVSLLRTINLPATVELENLWNEAIEEHSLSLLCSYAVEPESALPEVLLETHSDALTELL